MATHGGEQVLTCPECGARVRDGMTCWDRLGVLLAWEYQDPELLAEHFWTVACYNLQHPAQFTDEAISGLREAFVDRMDHGASIDEIRRRATAAFDGKKRVRKEESERRPVLHRWRMTIADVHIPDHAEGAAERVRRWAAAIRSELQL